MRDSVTIHLSLVSKSTRSSLFQKDREIEELKVELQQLKSDLQQQKDTNNTQMQAVRQQFNELSQEVQRQRTRQLCEFRQWRRNSYHHWMWLLLLIAVVGVVHSYLYRSSEEANTIREDIEKIDKKSKSFTEIELKLSELIDIKLQKRLLNDRKTQTLNCDRSPPSIATKDFQHIIMRNEIQYLGQQVNFPILPVHINLTQDGQTSLAVYALLYSPRRLQNVPCCLS